jgi:hypothetical protein
LAIHAASTSAPEFADDLKAHGIGQRIENAFQRYSIDRRMNERSLHQAYVRTDSR